MSHLLFGDAPYLYASLLHHRKGWSGGGNWHKRWCRKLADLQGNERVLVFCGLRRVTETWAAMQLAGTSADLAVTRLHPQATCSACLAALDRLLELGRAAVKPNKAGALVHLLFKPTALQITQVINRADPAAWDWSQVVLLREKKKRSVRAPSIDCDCPARNAMRCIQARYEGEGPVPVNEACECACHGAAQLVLSAGA